jgi:uncharacterized protein YndB with AHSA1/START domain/DNA-binding transcriptional ArsR family regulator
VHDHGEGDGTASHELTCKQLLAYRGAVPAGMDPVFKALADPTRRRLLDRLHEENGQTLGELSAELGMTRQAVTQHLALLQAANLVSTVRRGREKLHYLNPVPLHDIQERWIDKFERPRLRALSGLKRRAEENMGEKPTFVYVTYIESTPEKVWRALTDADLTGEYWGHRNISDWRKESAWRHVRIDGSGVADGVGTVLESDPPRRLVSTWALPDDPNPDDASVVTFDIEPYGEIVRLTVTHEKLADEQDRRNAASGWAEVMSNLKSLLETGHVLPRAPWEMD